MFCDFNYFYALFYVFAQAPSYIHLYDRYKIQSKIIMYLPFVIFIINVMCCSFIFLSSEHHPLKKSNSAVLYTIKFLGFVPNFVVIYSNLFETFDVLTLNSKLFFICDFLRIKLKIQFLITKFKFEICRDFIFYISVIMITHTSRIMVLTVYRESTEIAIFVMQLYKIVSILHALFYVKYFNFILISLNEGIKHKFLGPIILSQIILNSDSQRLNRNSTIFLHRTRFVYMKLWEVMQMFNTHCGCFLIAIMLESISSITNAIYGIFLYFVAFEDLTFYITRKYIHFIFCNTHKFINDKEKCLRTIS